MTIVGIDGIRKAPEGTIFLPLIRGEESDALLGGGPSVITKHLETGDTGGHLGGVTTFEPWPDVNGRYHNGPAYFDTIPISETDFGENTQFIIFEPGDVAKLLNLFSYSLSGDPRYLVSLGLEG